MGFSRYCVKFYVISFSLHLFLACIITSTVAVPKEVLLHSDNFFKINSPDQETYRLFFSLKITNETFNGFKDPNTGRTTPGLEPKRLSSFNTLRYIQGDLIVSAYHPEFTNLSFFNNLKTINHLVITNTSLTYLNLNELKEIKNGLVITHNKHLCVNSSEAFWRSFMHSKESDIEVTDNRPESDCATDCNEGCVRESGCWGPRSDQCRKCRHLREQSTKQCVNKCNNETQYETDGECWPCHKECTGGCFGSDDNECHYCAHVSRWGGCISKCSHDEYIRDGKCLQCNETCEPFGCSGPFTYVGEGGCNDSCPKLVIRSFDNGLGYFTCNRDCFTAKQCLTLNDTCPDEYFQVQIPVNATGEYALLAGKQVCTSCHSYCLKCTNHGFNNNVCQECWEGYKDCSCPSGSYYHKSLKMCKTCSHGIYEKSCKECTETGACASCNEWYYRVYDRGVPSENSAFKCMLDCPPHQPYIFVDKVYEKYCTSHNNTLLEEYHADYKLVYIYLTLTILVCLVAVFVYILMRRRANTYKTQIKINQFFEEPEETLETTNITHIRQKLRIIQESKLKRVKELACGYFGTVCQGFLSLEDNKTQVPVAINTLNTGDKSTLTKELLKEANSIGDINHPHLLRLLAICVTPNFALVTQFMPQGDMLQYLRQNKTEINQKTMMSWCVQIAKGMAHLEEHGIVHRNLAARKVLLNSLNQVKVTYFGSERALDIGRDIYVTLGEKLPTRWTSLESLKQGIFTHKSDTWSFGVTVWEILTYGEEPYASATFPGLLRRLEMGERLQQPETCPVDMYSVLATCWAQEAHARPSFQELVDTFTKMASDSPHFVTPTQEEETQTAPEPLPRNYYCEIDGADEWENQFTKNKANSHGYVNINKTESIE